MVATLAAGLRRPMEGRHTKTPEWVDEGRPERGVLERSPAVEQGSPAFPREEASASHMRYFLPPGCLGPYALESRSRNFLLYRIGVE